MSLPKIALLALCAVLLAASDARAQSQSDYWGKPADLKPLLPPIIPPPLIPPRSSLTTGSASDARIRPTPPMTRRDPLPRRALG